MLMERPERPSKERTGGPSEKLIENPPECPRTKLPIEMPKKPDDGLDNGLFEGFSPSAKKSRQRKMQKQERKAQMKDEGTWVQKVCNRRSANNT